MDTILTLKDVNTYYGHSHVLHGISLDITKGQVIAVLGRNGVGKTTMMRSVMGLTPIHSGNILFEGQEIGKKKPFEVAHLGIGYIPQGRRLFGSLTVREHLEVYYRKGNGVGWNLSKVLEFFPRLGQRIDNKASALSGGERQMLAIARALVTNPRMLLMDEPTEGLAPLIVAEVGRLIRQIKNEGFTILLTEQKLPFALDLADDTYIISKGNVVYHGKPAELKSNEEVKKAYLGL